MTKATFEMIWDSIFDVSAPGEHHLGGGFIQQDPQELWECIDYVNSINPQRILEIGNACGGTTLFWQGLAPLVVSLDTEPITGNINPGCFPYVDFILGDSHSEETLNKVKGFAPYDFLFIDGDHEAAGVRMDWDMYSPLVRKGGMVAFHDYGVPDVREAINSIGIPDKITQHSHFGIAIYHV